MSFAFTEINIPTLTVNDGTDFTFLNSTIRNDSWTTQNPAHMRIMNESQYTLKCTMKTGSDSFWLRPGESILITLAPNEIGISIICKGITIGATQDNFLLITYFSNRDVLFPIESIATPQVDSTQITGSGSVFGAILIPSTDVSIYKNFSLQLTGIWSGNVNVFASNDNVNFVPFFVDDIQFENSGLFQNMTYNSIFEGKIRFRYIEVQVVSYSSGTINAVLELYTQATGENSIAGVVSLTGGNNNIGNVFIGLNAGNTFYNGTSDFDLVSASGLNATSIKASQGAVFGFHVANTSSSWRYVKLYNKASAPAPATDTALLVRTIAIGPGEVLSYFNIGGSKSFYNGIGLATTANAAANDATGISANDVIFHLDWL